MSISWWGQVPRSVMGDVEGRNVVIVTRAAEQRLGDLPKLATELVAAHVDLIVAATGTPGVWGATAGAHIGTRGGSPVSTHQSDLRTTGPGADQRDEQHTQPTRWLRADSG
jgi:hypothetical protein